MASTRDDVARLAGVSSATVSRVYNNPERVSRNKREAVQKAAAKLHYQPNDTAARLRRGNPEIIHFLEIRRPPDTTWAQMRGYNWFYGDIIRGVQRGLTGSSYSLQLTQIDSHEELKNLSENPGCAGFIGFDIENIEDAEALRQTGKPFVLGHHGTGLQNYPRCSTSNYEGGRLAGAFLRERGYTRPLYITDRGETISTHQRRKEGFLSVWPDTPPPVRDIIKDDTYAAVKESLLNREYDSLAFVNDYTALEILRRLLGETDLKIPRDLGAIAYDHIPITRAFPFELATVELNLGEIYHQAAKLLLGLLSPPSTPEDHVPHRIIPPRIIPGNSLPRVRP